MFIEEPWRGADIGSEMFKDGIQLYDVFTLGAGERKEDLVVGYWRKSIAHNAKVLQMGKEEIWIEMGGIMIAGVCAHYHFPCTHSGMPL